MNGTLIPLEIDTTDVDGVNVCSTLILFLSGCYVWRSKLLTRLVVLFLVVVGIDRPLSNVRYILISLSFPRLFVYCLQPPIMETNAGYRYVGVA